MSITRLTQSQLKKWNRWLRLSHGLKELPGHVIYRCDIDYPMLLTPLPLLDNLVVRVERHSCEPMVAFNVVPGVQTIAGMWGDTDDIFHDFRHVRYFERGKSRLMKAANAGLLWWGTETFKDDPNQTSVCYLFPKDFPFPDSTRLDLPPESTETLETNLNLE